MIVGLAKVLALDNIEMHYEDPYLLPTAAQVQVDFRLSAQNGRGVLLKSKHHTFLDVCEEDCIRLAFGFVVLAVYALDRRVPDQL